MESNVSGLSLRPGLELICREWRRDSHIDGSTMLGACDVHIWWYSLGGALQPEMSALLPLLSDEEHYRAGKFRFDKDRDDFVLSRTALRSLAGAYLEKSPAQVRFSYSTHGKPFLAPAHSPSRLSFNISHTDGLALFAFTLDRRIGIDVEKVRKDFEPEQIAERFFSVAERRALRETPQEQKKEAFFRCWTRKEAFIKAKGSGLSHPLDQFDVSILPNDEPALLATRPNPEEARSWIIRSLEMPSQYIAAVAVESNRIS